MITYERSAATISNSGLRLEENSVVQHVADNADHNLCTLDGKGTFHGMAIIAAITPQAKRTYPIVPRVKMNKILDTYIDDLITYSNIISMINFR